MQGVSTIDLEPGDYTIAPSERVREYEQREAEAAFDPMEAIEVAKDGISELRENDLFHQHDVETASGTTVMHVLEDTRHVDGMVGAAGKRYLFLTPDGEPVMRLDREGMTPNSPWSLREGDTETTLATVNTAGWVLDHWTLADANGEHRATAKFQLSLTGFLSPTHVVKTPDGTDIAEFSGERRGRHTLGEVRLLGSPVPPEVGLGFAFGVMHRHLNQ